MDDEMTITLSGWKAQPPHTPRAPGRGTPLDVPVPLPWRKRAMCRGMDVNVFFDTATRSVALATCMACPVWEDCLQAALANETKARDRIGIFGGVPAEYRLRLASTRRPVKEIVAVKCTMCDVTWRQAASSRVKWPRCSTACATELRRRQQRERDARKREVA